LAFSYWFDKPQFLTEGKLATVLIIPSSWGSQLGGYLPTSANRRETPTFEKLDRILASVEWEQKFPLVLVRALTRSSSDHTPLLLDSGDQAFVGNKNNSRLS
jgi:hypothetical protein